MRNDPGIQMLGEIGEPNKAEFLAERWRSLCR